MKIFLFVLVLLSSTGAFAGSKLACSVQITSEGSSSLRQGLYSASTPIVPGSKATVVTEDGNAELSYSASLYGPFLVVQMTTQKDGISIQSMSTAPQLPQIPSTDLKVSVNGTAIDPTATDIDLTCGVTHEK